MSDDMMNTRDVAEYLGIHEKQVYALIKAGKIPCTRITGKWLFPRHIIDEWIDNDAKNSAPGIDLNKRKTANQSEPVILAGGSNDPILDILLNNVKSVYSDFSVYSSTSGSTQGLELLKKGVIDIAWCHLLEPSTGEYNIPYITSELSNKKIAIVHLFYREQGFVFKPDLGIKISDFKDFAQSGKRFINRQKGSGTRVLIDYNLEKIGVDGKDIPGYNDEVFTHFEVGISILSHRADIGIATVSAAKLLGLEFVPLVKESFDMIIYQETFFDKGVQTFIEILKSEDFREKVKPLGDYDFSDSGKILYSSV